MVDASNPFGAPQENDDDEFDVDLGEDNGGGLLLPTGYYEAVLTDLDKGQSNAGNPMWVWQLRLTGNLAQKVGGNASGKMKIEPGDQKLNGREFRIYTAITPAAMWKLRETLLAFGLSTGKEKNSKFKKADAIRRMCIVHLVDDEYQDVKRSSVKKALPHPESTGKMFEGKFKDSDIPF